MTHKHFIATEKSGSGKRYVFKILIVRARSRNLALFHFYDRFTSFCIIFIYTFFFLKQLNRQNKMH